MAYRPLLYNNGAIGKGGQPDMITRYNTNREATGEIISASLLMALILAIAPPALAYTAPNSPTTSDLLYAYLFFWGCGLLLLLFCVYRYFHRSEHDDAYLLSSRTLAIVSPGKPVRFIKPHDIVAFKPNGPTLLREDGTPLRLPRLLPEPGKTSLPIALVAAWYGEATLGEAKRVAQDSIRPSAKAIALFMLLVSVALLVALGLALAGMWRAFAGFIYPAFIAGMCIGGVYQMFRAYKADKLVISLVQNPEDERDGTLYTRTGRSPARPHPVAIRRLPDKPPQIWRLTGGSLLVLLGLFIFIPLCRLILSYDTLEPATRYLVYLIGFDLMLVAAYCIWRLYEGVVRGDAFVTVLLSSRTIAILRPRKSVDYIKPEECAALVCGRNELVLHDGRILALAKDLQLDEERTVCKTLCQHWWPDAYGDEPEGLWANISTPCRRQIGIGVCIALIGFAILIPCPGPWGTAIAHHFLIPGAIYALYGFLRGLRGHGRMIDLTAPDGEQHADG